MKRKYRLIFKLMDGHTLDFLTLLGCSFVTVMLKAQRENQEYLSFQDINNDSHFITRARIISVTAQKLEGPEEELPF